MQDQDTRPDLAASQSTGWKSRRVRLALFLAVAAAAMVAASASGLTTRSLGTATAPPAASSATPPTGAVAATVGGENIYESEILAEMAAGAQGSRNDVLDSYINLVLAARAAKSDEVAEQLQYTKRKVLSQAYIGGIAKKFGDTIDDAAVKDFYDKNVVDADYDRYQVSYYLTQDDADASKRLAEFQAAQSLDKLQVYTSRSTREKLVAARELPYGTGQVVSRMKKGEIVARPLMVSDGLLILRLDEVQKGAKPTLDQVKPQIRLALVQRHIAADLASKRKGAEIRIVR